MMKERVSGCRPSGRRPAVACLFGAHLGGDSKEFPGFPMFNCLHYKLLDVFMFLCGYCMVRACAQASFTVFGMATHLECWLAELTAVI